MAAQAYDTAVARGKICENDTHDDVFFGILEELREFREASESAPSVHVPELTEAEEELVDVYICCLTELHRRVPDVERAVKLKLNYNKTRR